MEPRCSSKGCMWITFKQLSTVCEKKELGAVWPARTQHFKEKRRESNVSTKRRRGRTAHGKGSLKKTKKNILNQNDESPTTKAAGDGILMTEWAAFQRRRVVAQGRLDAAAGRRWRVTVSIAAEITAESWREGGLLELFLTSSFLSMWKWWTFKLKIVMICKEISLEKKSYQIIIIIIVIILIHILIQALFCLTLQPVLLWGM